MKNKLLFDCKFCRKYQSWPNFIWPSLERWKFYWVLVAFISYNAINLFLALIKNLGFLKAFNFKFFYKISIVNPPQFVTDYREITIVLIVTCILYWTIYIARIIAKILLYRICLSIYPKDNGYYVEKYQNNIQQQAVLALDHLSKEILVEKYTESALNIDRFQAVVNKNVDSLIAIRSITDGDRYSAFSLVSGISESCVKNINNHIHRNGHQIGLDEITQNYKDAYGLYVFGVYSINNRHSKAYLIRVLKIKLYKIFKQNSNVQQIFARPGTIDGLRIIKNAGFNPVLENHNDEIWSIDRTKVLRNVRSIMR